MATPARKPISLFEKSILDALSGISDTDPVVISTLHAAVPQLANDHFTKSLNALRRKNLVDMAVNEAGAATVRLVTAATAAKLGELDAEERMVYEAVKAAASEGILQVTLRSRVPVAENVIVKSLKKLEGRGLIKQVKSVKYGNKKMFMLSELQPSVELTGGVWFTNQELDVTFVEHMSAAVLRFVGKNSYPTDGSMSIYPTAFSDHPTLPQIAKFLRTSQAAKVDLSVSDIGLLLDMLVYDGKLERIPMPAVTLSMGGDASMDVDYNDDMDLDADDADNGGDLGEQWMYRLVRERVGTTGLGTMPCGVCPVMRDCGQPGSAVDPVSCDYMKRWLDF